MCREHNEEMLRQERQLDRELKGLMSAVVGVNGRDGCGVGGTRKVGRILEAELNAG